MSILSVDPIPGAESSYLPAEGTPIKLAELSTIPRLRSPDGAPVGVVYLGVGDTVPALRVQVVDDAGNPVNLAGCQFSLKLVARQPPGHVVFQNQGEIIAPVAGFLEYEWTESDTQLAGYYMAQCVITDVDGDQMTLPGGSGIPVVIS